MPSEVNRSIFNPLVSLPSQMIPMSEKNEEWVEEVANRLEQIGRHQLQHNLGLVENYEIIKGKFIFHHYFDSGNYDDMLGQLTKEFDLPKYLRHYDIISQVVNVLSGEYQKRPDNFRVRGTDELTKNQFVRDKSRMLLEFVMSEVNAKLDMQLTEEGWEIDKQDFESEEEAQQYQQELGSRRQALTPPEIEQYMTYNWSTVAEKWGQVQLQQDKKKYNLPEKERKEFEDMLTADRCFRHFYVTGEDYNQETWNPVNTFFHHSPEIDYVEDGDYVGRVIYLSPSAIIDRYGWRMDKSQINKIKKILNRIKSKGGKGSNYLGIQYGSTVPFQNFEDFKRLNDAFVPDPTDNKFKENGFLSNVLGGNGYSVNQNGLWQVTEGYFKSQKKIGKVIYFDEEGNIQKTLVDETWIVPPTFTEVDSTIYDSDQPNTVVWTWVNEVRDIVKINPLFSEDKDCIYLGGQPLQFQFKSDWNPYGCKLPVCGGIFNNRNGESASLVDMMKPHQIGYNVAMNQLYQLMEREVGRFVIMDVNLLPKVKDWGGEKGWEKFMMVARGLGMAPADTSIKNTTGTTASSGHFPQVIDLDESARMMSRIEIANYFEQKALSQVGITPQRLGTTAASETATGVQQAVSQSYAQTESYFTRFNNYKARCLRMALDIAQYIQSKKENVTVSYTKDDMSRAFMKINGTELSLYDLGIFVTNTNEDIRQLETLRQLAIENNTTGATIVDLADIVMINSPLEIRARLEKSLKAQQAREGQMQEIEQQKVESAKEMQAAQQQFEAEQNQLDRDNRIEEAYIKTFGGANNTNTTDADANAVPDILEFDKFSAATKQADRKLNLEEQKLSLQAQLAIRQEQLERDKLAQKDRSDMAKLKVARENKTKAETKKK